MSSVITNPDEMMDEIIRFFNDEIMINIEDIYSIIDVIHRNNKKINDKLHLELENHKIIINDLSMKLDKYKITINTIAQNNDVNRNIIRYIIDKIEKNEKNGHNHYYYLINLFIGGIFIYINFFISIYKIKLCYL